MYKRQLDAWITPIEMKRNRPAATVSALIEPTQVAALGSVLLAETGSLGYRAVGVERSAVTRTVGTVSVDGHVIAIKQSNNTAKAEFVDVVKAAEALDRPARIIAAEAERLWQVMSLSQED